MNNDLFLDASTTTAPSQLFRRACSIPSSIIVPGVIIVEALAQTAGVVAGIQFIKENRSVLFMSINSVKFRKPVKPNENISFFVEKINQVKNAYKFSGKAKVNDTIVTESVFTAMII